MGVDRAIDITAKQRKIVTDLLERHLPDTAAWIYGSRVKWTARPQSDLDMVVFATPEQNGRVSDLREALEESNLPFRVDLFVWDAVPEQFRKHIKWDHVVLVKREQREVESGWCEVTLDQLGRIVTGKTPPSSIQGAFGGDIPFVTPIDLDGRRMIASTARSLTEKGVKVVYNSRIPARSVMVSCIGSDMGKAAIAARECVTNQQINSIVVDSGDEPLFAYYNLSNRKAEIRAAAGGSAQPILNKSGFGQFDILLPPPNQQRAIAHILGTLEAMARALFKSWLVDFDPVRAKMAGRDTGLPSHLADLFPDRLVDSELGEIPEGWRIRQLGEMAIVVDCLHSRKPERQKDGPVLIQVFNIGPTGRLDFSNPYNVTEDDYAEWTRRMEVLPGDLVVTKTGRVGAVGQMPKGYKAAMGRNMVGVRAILGRSLPGFLKDSLLSDRMCREMMRNTNDGTILRSLHVKAISQLQEVLPPYDLVSSYEALIAPVHAKLEQNDVESKTLATMRDVLLPKLVSGEIHLHAAERAVENIQ